MKEIKTQNYALKISQFQAPVGDSNLMPGVSQRDIDRQYGGIDDDAKKREGESELTISGKPIHVNYTYVYDYNENRANNIKIRSAFDIMTKKEITNPSMFSYIQDAFMEQIEADIEMQEEDEKNIREQQNNPLEYD
jgi:hypothetical protein